MPPCLSVRFNPETTFRRTLWIIATLVGASLLAACVQIKLGHGRLLGLADLVHLDHERNLPTLFSSVQLLLAGSIAWYLGVKETIASSRWLWRFLGTVLGLMALDETASIHELGNNLDLGEWGKLSYFQFCIWVLPAIAVVTVCGVVLLKLLFALPRRTAAMFVLSGLVFVMGAVGMEMIGVQFYKPPGKEDWIYTICYTLEESLEMLGPALFIRTALRYAIAKEAEAAEDAAVMADALSM